MAQARLHYIADPLCGWCYAVAPLVRAARDVDALDVVWHGGGMMAGANRQPVTPQLRNYVMPHDHRIAALTGQPFGDAYFEGLLRDTTAVFDSAPPTAAVLAAQALAGRGLDMFAAVQRAHYVEGKRIADGDVLVALAESIELNGDAFRAALAKEDAAALTRHFTETRMLMSRVGGNGFPTFALEIDGQWQRVDPGQFLGHPEAWRDALVEQLRAWHSTQEGIATSATDGPACGPDGCTS